MATRISRFEEREMQQKHRRFANTPHFAEFMGELSFSAYQELGYDGFCWLRASPTLPYIGTS